MRWPVSLLSALLACAAAEPSPSAGPSKPVERPAAESVEAAPAPAPAQEVEAAPAPAPEPVPAAPVCDATAIEAARTVLAVAPKHGANARHLADCRPEQVVCEAERRPLLATDACQIFAYQRDARWEIIVVPRPATGAPTSLESGVDETGKEAVRPRVHGSTWGVVDGVRIEGKGAYASHDHGGDPAKSYVARCEVENQRDEPVTLGLLGTRWLSDSSCGPPRKESARLEPAGIAIDPAPVSGKETVEIPAKSSHTVTLGHEARNAYNAHCNRFATAARFEVDGERVEVIAEHRVVRREPKRFD